LHPENKFNRVDIEAKNSKGFSVGDIAEITGLTDEEIREII
jgi:hypothetical protein